MQDVDYVHWEEAATKEFSFLLRDYTGFTPVDRSTILALTKLLGGRFVFRTKRYKAGNVTSFNDGMVARGFSPRPDIDFKEIFAPVAKFVPIRTQPHPGSAFYDRICLHGYIEE